MSTTLQSLTIEATTPDKMSPNPQANQFTPPDDENTADLFHKLQLIRNENRKRWSENVQRESAAMIQDMMRDFNEETAKEARDDNCVEKRRVPLQSLTNTNRDEMKNCKPYSSLTIIPPLDSPTDCPPSPSTPKHSPNQSIGIAKPMYETADNYVYDPSTLFNFAFQSQATTTSDSSQGNSDCPTPSPCGSSCLSYFDDRLSVIQECDEEMSVEKESFESIQDIVRAQGDEEAKCRDDTESESNNTDITVEEEGDASMQDTRVESDEEKTCEDDKLSEIFDTDTTLEEPVTLPRALGPLLHSSEQHYSNPVSERMYEEEHQQQFCTEGCFFINGLTKLFVGKRNQDCLVKGC